MSAVPTCKYCGCTDRDCRQCIEKTGDACYWVDHKHTVCSACSPYGFMMFSDRWVQAISVDDRRSRLEAMNQEQLERALEWPDTQKTLLSTIRRLLKQFK